MALRVAMPGEYAKRAVHLGSVDESHCFLYLMLTVGLATALGVTALLVAIYCIYHCGRPRGRRDKSTATGPPVEQVGSPLETLMELQVLDALSRSVRQKKQHVHQEMMKLYGPAGNADNVYTPEPSCKSPSPSAGSAMTVKQMKQRQQKRNITTVTLGQQMESSRNRQLDLLPDDHYWEIGLPPTPV